MNLNIMTVKTKVSTSTDLNAAISAGCVCVCVYISSVCLPFLCPWKESLMVSSFAGICWNQTLCSAVCTPATMDEKRPIQPIATSLIKSGEDARRCVASHTTEFNQMWAELTPHFLLVSFALRIIWRNLAIPTCGFRLWEDYIFPLTLQRFVLRSSIVPVEHHFCVLQPYHVGTRSCFSRVCVWAVLWAPVKWRAPWSYWGDESSPAWLCTNSLSL